MAKTLGKQIATKFFLDKSTNSLNPQVAATNCWQANCQYSPWSPWSSTCGQVNRQRRVTRKQYVMKTGYGGCAAYSINCLQVTESKNLGTCVTCKLDIGFLLDESGSIGSSGFNQELHFVKNIAKQLTVSSSNTHVSVMTFASSAQMRNYFRDSNAKSQYYLERLVNSIRYRGGGTDTERALNLARTHMFHSSYGARSGVSKVVVVFTDGRSASGVARVRAAAQKLKDMSINMISIGVGSSISVDELNAMASSSGHVFRVSGANYLNSIVSKVKTESCKVFTCVYAECTHGQWGSWSRSCGDATRQRPVTRTVLKSKQVVGGCAGLSRTCKPLQEQKNLGVCLRTCNYVVCNYGLWSAWSSTCGYGQRTRKMVPTRKTIQRATCSGLTTSCSTRALAATLNVTMDLGPPGHLLVASVEGQEGTCNYVECNYGPWSAWSSTCGYGRRSRRFVPTRKTVQRTSCSGLTTSCSTGVQYNVRNQRCTCNYVQCNYGSWSAWSTSCGAGQRTRKMVPTQKTTQRTSCAGLPTSCSTSVSVDKRTKLCTCNYVECNYGPWSAWTTTCGAGQRARKMVATPKSEQKASCSGLPKSCSTALDVDKRTKLCTCNYVQCNYGQWSAWTTTCGAGQRARKMVATPKSEQKASCSGLPKSCSTALDVDKRTKLCTCNYVQCNYGQWSAWTTTCGAGERSRKMVATPKTEQKASCSGLPKSCSTALDVDKRTKLCTCNYVQCNYGSWSAWTTTCGAGQRTRKMVPTQKTTQRTSCAGLPTSCSTSVSVDKRNKLCTCNYVQCNYGQWSAWTTTCGAGQRARKMVATPKSEQKTSCSGLPKSCSTALDVDKRTKLCTCNYVECNYGPWSAWTTTCGAGERSRKMVATPKTAQKASCSGLPKSCSTALDVDKRTKLCTCNYVECNYGPWSAWTTTCGAGERSRKMVATPKTAQKASCSGLPKSCSTALDVDKRTKLCTCNYVECNYGPWSAWTTTCGAGERSRKMVATPKTEQKASCSGLPKSCSTALDVIKRTKLCTCNYVECNYGPWSAWTTTCGAGERSRKMVATPKTAQKASCSGLPKSCSTALHLDKRTKLCTCNYVECNYGPWSAWTTTCGAGERSRKMVATPKSEQKTSCSGLPKSCSTALDLDKRTKLCTCNYVECNYGPWSAWTTTCGAGERSRKMVATPKSEQKTSCSGLPKSCSTALDLDKRTKLCTCQYADCSQMSEWSSWSTSCGDGYRTRHTVATPKTVEKESCAGLQQKCQNSTDTDSRKTDCQCQTVRCQPSEWSQWSATCGPATRTSRFIAIPVTIAAPSCSGLPTKCSNSIETQQRDLDCNTNPNKGSSCSVKFKALGCYKDEMVDPRPLPQMIITERDSGHPSWNGRYVEWNNWDAYMVKAICRCAEKTKSMKYTYFGMQFFGECWSGPEAGGSYSKNGPATHGSCVKEKYAPCLASDKLCIGQKGTNFVYQITTVSLSAAFAAEQVVCPYPTGSSKCSGSSPLIGFGTLYHKKAYAGTVISIRCEFSCCGNVSLSWLVNGKPFNKTKISFTTTYASYLTSGVQRTNAVTKMKFLASSDSDQGFYKCVLEQGQFKMLSSNQALQFAGFSFAQLKYTISSINFTSDFQNVSSNAYKSVQSLVSNEVARKLNSFPLNTRRHIEVYEITNHQVGIAVFLIVLQYANTIQIRKDFCTLFYTRLSGPFNSFTVHSAQAFVVDCCQRETTGNANDRGIITWDYTPITTGFSTSASTKCPYHVTNNVQYATRSCYVNYRYTAVWASVNNAACFKLQQLTEDSIKLCQAVINDYTILPISETLISPTRDNNGTARNSSHISLDVKVMENIIKSDKATNKNIDNGNVDYLHFRIDNLLHFVMKCNEHYHCQYSATNRSKACRQFSSTEQIFAVEWPICNCVKSYSSVSSTSPYRYQFQVLDNLLTLTNHLLSLDASTIATAQKDYDSSNRLLLILDELGRQYKVNGTDQKVDVTHDNLIFMAANVEMSVKSGAQFETSPNENSSQLAGSTIKYSRRSRLSTGQERSETAFIPFEMLQTSSALRNASSVKVYGYIYADDKLFRRLWEPSNSTQKTPQNVSRVINLSIMNTSVVNSSDNIQLFWPVSTGKNYNQPICSFWDFSINDWSKNGCSLKYSPSNQIVCQCNHMTNFSLLFNYDDNTMAQLHKTTLSIITFIGCGLSLTGLLLTMITVALFGKIRKLLPPKILMGLSLSLSATFLVFVFGVEQIFKSNRFPLVLVIAIASSRFYQDYGSGQYCIVTGSSFYVALLAPIATILVVNIFILVRVMISINKKPRTEYEAKQFAQKQDLVLVRMPARNIKVALVGVLSQRMPGSLRCRQSNVVNVQTIEQIANPVLAFRNKYIIPGRSTTETTPKLSKVET
eukprot:gene18007-19809_t